MRYTFGDAKAPSRRTTQYFEIIGNRAIYHDGWLAGTVHKAPWEAQPRVPLADDTWELYDTRQDFSLANDLAAKEPGKLKELQDLFMREASKYYVLPIDDRSLERLNPATAGRPDLMGDRTSLTVYSGMTGIGENVFLNVKNRSHTITAEVVIPRAGANGVILAQGGRFGGWSLYLKDGKPAYTYNWLDLKRYTIAAAQPLAAGKATIRLEFAYDGGGLGKGGTGTIVVNGKRVASGRIDRTIPFIISGDDGVDVGVDEGTPVTAYRGDPHGRFTGKIDKVTVSLTPVKAADGESGEGARKAAAAKKALSD